MPMQKQVNTKHADGMPKQPQSVAGKSKPEPKSGVDQKKVDTDHADKSPKQPQSVAGQTKKEPAFQKYLQTKIDNVHADKTPAVPSDTKSMMKSVNSNLWKSLESMVNKLGGTVKIEGEKVEGDVLEEGKKKDEKKKKGKLLGKDSNKIKDGGEHFPIDTIVRGRNALSRCSQYDSVPSWFDGSLKELQDMVKRAVHKKYPSIEITKK